MADVAPHLSNTKSTKKLESAAQVKVKDGKGTEAIMTATAAAAKSPPPVISFVFKRALPFCCVAVAGRAAGADPPNDPFPPTL